jgi:hypothetical protein
MINGISNARAYNWKTARPCRTGFIFGLYLRDELIDQTSLDESNLELATKILLDGKPINSDFKVRFVKNVFEV